MRRGEGLPLADRVRRGGTESEPTAPLEHEGGRHCWVVDAPAQPGRYPGVLLEWRRRDQAWDGLVAYVLPEPHGEGAASPEVV
jgi:hypothetical protein